ncbi:MAG TPA: HAD family hydrolase [Candidatus Limnocylindrales bacterium]
MTAARPPSGDPLAGIDLVIFDKDGTLIDFDAMWAPWLVELATRLDTLTGRALASRLFETLGFDAVAGRTIAGSPLAVTPMAQLREMVVGVLVDAGVDEGVARAALAKAWHPPDPVALAKPTADLVGLFHDLRAAGRRIAVATSDDRQPTEATLAGLGVGDLVDAIAAADDRIPVKPSPDAVAAICARVGVEPSRTAVVGDSAADMAMGRAAGCGRVIGVLSGVSARADLERNADLVLDSVADLVLAR